MTIRNLDSHEYDEAIEIVWNSFMETEAEFYSEDGIKQFHRIISDRNWIESLEIYGAFVGDILIGIIATGDCGKHIALFFVSPKFQRHGVGRQLFNHMKDSSGCNEYTVNSSHYARDIYRKLGFKDTDTEQNDDGIIYTPMMLKCA